MSEPFPDPPVLDYRPPSPFRTYRPLPAVLLCLPGVMCWIVLLSEFLPISLYWMALRIRPTVFLLWPLAVITAIWSLILYRRRSLWRRPWYVVMCLTLNIGVIFIALVIIALIVAIALWPPFLGS